MTGKPIYETIRGHAYQAMAEEEREREGRESLGFRVMGLFPSFLKCWSKHRREKRKSVRVEESGDLDRLGSRPF